MKIINDGKWNLFTIKIFRIKIELDFWITDSYSYHLSNYGKFIFRYWKRDKLLKLKEFFYIKLKYKIAPNDVKK
jgi:hypothetical protein